MSWIASTFLGSQAGTKVRDWSEPAFEAFVAGAWMLCWTDDTLYWVAHPRVHLEKTAMGRRLHNDKFAAIESDAENLYFWHGVMVPAFVVVRPDWITIKHIEEEQNAEVRRVMIERYGQDHYLQDSKAEKMHEDDWGVLYRKEIPNDEALVMVKVVNSTPEADGSFKDYFLRVPPNMTRARQAVAWTFGKEETEYEPMLQT